MAKRKNPDAVGLGRLGGKARAERMSPEERAESARKAVRARWEKAKKKAVEAEVGDFMPSIRRRMAFCSSFSTDFLTGFSRSFLRQRVFPASWQHLGAGISRR